MVDGTHVIEAGAESAGFLGSVADAEWSVPVPDLDMNVSEVVCHAAEGCLWYAIDLAAAGKDLTTIEHHVKPDSVPGDLVDTLLAYATVIARTVDLAPPDVLGFHPFGQADPSGFAAMACDELLIHTDDVGRALGTPFVPSTSLAEAVLRRLFPWVDGPEDPWQLLLWANGRIALGDRPRLEGWRWHCAPLDQWSGDAPSWLPAGTGSTPS